MTTCFGYLVYSALSLLSLILTPPFPAWVRTAGGHENLFFADASRKEQASARAARPPSLVRQGYEGKTRVFAIVLGLWAGNITKR